jgi:hypothetical protein
MMHKQPQLNGSIPRAYNRSLRTGRWDNGIDLSWLPLKQDDPIEDSSRSGLGTGSEADWTASSASPNCDSGSSNSSSTSSSNNAFSINLINMCNNSSFIFRDSDSRSTSSNLGEDDSTKRRGVG